MVYLTATACVEFFVPLISICALNLAVYLNIRQRSRGLIRSENPQFLLDKNLMKEIKAENGQNHAVVQNSSTLEKLKSDEVNNNLDIKSFNKKSLRVKKKALMSTSSTTCSTSSLDESLRLNAHLNNGIFKNTSMSLKTSDQDLNEAEKSSSNLTPPKLSPSRHLQITLHANESNTTLVLSPTQSNKGQSFAKKAHSTRANLTKDKKAARSLFILVFVFVFCWVSQFKKFLTF